MAGRWNMLNLAQWLLGPKWWKHNTKLQERFHPLASAQGINAFKDLAGRSVLIWNLFFLFQRLLRPSSLPWWYIACKSWRGRGGGRQWQWEAPPPPTPPFRIGPWNASSSPPSSQARWALESAGTDQLCWPHLTLSLKSLFSAFISLQNILLWTIYRVTMQVLDLLCWLSYESSFGW